VLNYGEQEPAGEVPMPKNIAKKVEELHAALPEQFKDFIRRVAAVPKAAIEEKDGTLKADTAANTQAAERKKAI
jgi:hypothetical protein